MHEESHRIITERVTKYLISMGVPVALPNNFVEILVRENIDLDREPESLVKRYYSTRRKTYREFERKIPHHSDRIEEVSERLPSEVRRFFLSYDKREDLLERLEKIRREVVANKALSERGAVELGRVLHYIQDRCVPAPSKGEIHDEIEDKAKRYHGLLNYPTIYNLRPTSRRELREVIYGQPVARTPREAVIIGASYSFAVLYGVLGALKPPDSLIEKLVKLRQWLSGRRLKLYLGLALTAFISTIAILIDALRVAHDLYILYLIWLSWILLMALTPGLFITVYKTENTENYLRMLHLITRKALRDYAVFLTVTFLVTLFISPLFAMLFFFSNFLLIYIPCSFKEIDEILEEYDWYAWDFPLSELLKDEFQRTLDELERMAKEAVKEQELFLRGKRVQTEWPLAWRERFIDNTVLQNLLGTGRQER